MDKLNPAQALILGVLHSGSRTGADIVRIADGMDFWTFARSQIYREMQSLENLGAVSAMKMDGRSALITLRPLGRQLYAEWVAVQAETADVQIRDSWYLRYRLSEFDGTDRTEVCTEAAAHHASAATAHRHRGLPGAMPASARAAAAYHAAMGAYFQHVAADDGN